VRLVVLACAAACAAVPASGGADGPAAQPPPLPIGEHLTYSVRYLGIHCGLMTLSSFADDSSNGLYHIVMEARTSSFFDGIYRVRVRIESTYDGARDSSVSYHHHGQEKGDTKDELWTVDFAADQVRRTKDGEVTEIPFTGDRVLDPLSFLYRMRRLLGAAGDRATLPMMTSDGDVETVAEVAEKKSVKTPFGRREVLVVVPYPAKDELFSKKGRMEIWVGADDDRLPYRIVFDLPFGKLMAKLAKVEPHAEGVELTSGEEI
jgi:hypothetical protein